MCNESVEERRDSDQKHREIKLLLEWHEQSRVLVHREI